MEIPTLDLDQWRVTGPGERSRIAHRLDTGLRRLGLIQLSGHGVPGDLRAELRAQARSFFSLPAEAKARYSIRGNGNGWRSTVNTGALYGAETPADLHEAFLAGSVYRTGDPELDEVYYPANQWPVEIPCLRAVADGFTDHMTRVAREVLGVLAETLGVPPDFFLTSTSRATWTLSLNWYPSLKALGTIVEGQSRVAPHTDFGTVSLLDREPGVGGLQAWREDAGWFEPPHDRDALLVILGDLMNLWTDGRWNAARHRVLPPSGNAPEEELTSLVFFFEANPDAVVTPLAAPAGGGNGMKSVVAGEWIREKLGILNA